jgi:hypothetical protein
MSIDTIPSDILLLIINNLDCKDVISLLKVNKLIYEWQNLLRIFIRTVRYCWVWEKLNII